MHAQICKKEVNAPLAILDESILYSDSSFQESSRDSRLCKTYVFWQLLYSTSLSLFAGNFSYSLFVHYPVWVHGCELHVRIILLLCTIEYNEVGIHCVLLIHKIILKKQQSVKNSSLRLTKGKLQFRGYNKITGNKKKKPKQRRKDSFIIYFFKWLINNYLLHIHSWQAI